MNLLCFIRTCYMLIELCLAIGIPVIAYKAFQNKGKEEHIQAINNINNILSAMTAELDITTTTALTTTISTQKVFIESISHTDSRIECLAFNSDNILATGYWDNTVKIQNVITRELYTLKGHTSRVLCLTFTSSNILASSSADNVIKIWDVDSRTELRTLKSRYFPNIGKRLVYIGDNMLVSEPPDTIHGRTKLWNVKTGMVKVLETNYNYQLQHDYKKYEERRFPFDRIDVIKNANTYRSFAFSSNNLLAVGHNDNTIRLWNVSDFYWKELRILRGHTDLVSSLAFNSDNVLASGSVDRTIKLWNVMTGTVLSTLNEHEGLVKGLAFNKRENLLASISDHMVVIVEIVEGNTNIEIE